MSNPIKSQIETVKTTFDANINNYKKRVGYYEDRHFINEALKAVSKMQAIAEMLLNDKKVAYAPKFAFTEQSITTLPQQAEPNKQISLRQLFEMIKTTNAPEIYQEIKRLNHDAFNCGYDHTQQIKKLKNSLPYFLCSGFCPIHHNNETLQYNQCLQIDIDFKQKEGYLMAYETKRKIKEAEFPFVLFAALSPSGYGVKVLVITDNTAPCNHKDLQEQLILFFARYLALDKAYFDVLGLSQPCFLPYDPDVFTNDDIAPYKYVPTETKPTIQTKVVFENSNDLAIKAVNFLIERKCDVAGQYDDYFKVLATCINVFGHDTGLSIAQQILENSQTYLISTFRKNIEKHAKTIDPTRAIKLGEATIMYLAKAHGFLS